MALPNTNIIPGRPPLLWSDVHDAFKQVNENFTALDLATGGTAVDLATLNTNVTPNDTNTYQLGNILKQWKNVYTAEWSSIAGSELNGLWAGSAQIKGVGLTVNLPENSTIGGDPETGIGVIKLIDPEKTFFKEIQVDNNFSVVATGFGDTVNLLSGAGIQLSVNSGSDSIEIDNTGILSVAAGAGMSSSTTAGVATIVNTGVRSLSSTTGLPAGRTLGAGINVSAGTGDSINITNTGILSVAAGVGITVSTDTATGQVQITNSAPAVNAFAQVEINGDIVNRLLADSVSDVLSINSGQGITLTKNTVTDTLTITVNPVFDLKGSVFGDDSTKIVDAVENKVYADFFGNLTGNVTGNADTATTASKATTVTLVATNTTAALHFITFVDTATGDENIRTDTSLTYNPNTNTLTAGTFATGSLTITGSTIGTTDSSGIIVNELTTFNTDVVMENDLSVNQRFLLRGSRVLNLTELKSVVAASASFADFQARIAALV